MARSGKRSASGPAANAGAPPPKSAEEALARARDHGRAALAESLAAIQALLDATALGLSGKVADQDAVLGPVARSLEELRSVLAPDPSRVGASVLDALFEALDAEVARWELKSREDPEARSVLRAFLGVREILWEITSRGTRAAPESDEGASESKPEPAPARPVRSRRGARVQRVRVEG